LSLRSQHKKKFWYKLFGEYRVGTLVRPNSEFIRHYPEIWIWFATKPNGVDEYVKIPSSKFIGRIVKKDEFGTYSIRWFAERDKIEKRFVNPYLHWNPNQFEVI